MMILHTQLEKESFLLKELELCQIRLMNNACFPWLILIPQREHAIELFDLVDSDQALIQQEICQTALRLKQHTQCDKINIATLGNVVSQLHIHIIARFHDDAVWPKPVWGTVSEAYNNPATIIAEYQRLF